VLEHLRPQIGDLKPHARRHPRRRRQACNTRPGTNLEHPLARPGARAMPPSPVRRARLARSSTNTTAVDGRRRHSWARRVPVRRERDSPRLVCLPGMRRPARQALNPCASTGSDAAAAAERPASVHLSSAASEASAVNAPSRRDSRRAPAGSSCVCRGIGLVPTAVTRGYTGEHRTAPEASAPDRQLELHGAKRIPPLDEAGEKAAGERPQRTTDPHERTAKFRDQVSARPAAQTRDARTGEAPPARSTRPCSVAQTTLSTLFPLLAERRSHPRQQASACQNCDCQPRVLAGDSFGDRSLVRSTALTLLGYEPIAGRSASG
jgi:hypothetical protein